MNFTGRLNLQNKLKSIQSAGKQF